MTVRAEENFAHRFLFTAPWDPVVVRRGDALGLRALADQFADALAPGLSNRVTDGRWVTILAWCLARSDEVFRASGGRAVETRIQLGERYAWLRPLELMWVARTISLAPEGGRDRALAGQRRVGPWCKDDKRSADRFGMSIDQFRAYRQTGMYGGYRVAFREWPGMSLLGDGWRPGAGTIELANWLDPKLGPARLPWKLHAGDGDKRGFPAPNKQSLGKEDEWWLRQWKTFKKGNGSAEKNTLPRRRDEFEKLPEADLLRPLIFGDDRDGKRRLATASEVKNASADTHFEVCEHLGRVSAADPRIALLPHFSRLADAGMAAMDLVAGSLQKESHVELVKVAALSKAGPVCTELMEAAQEWRTHAQIQLPHVDTAQRFANAIPSAKPIECLKALLVHHERHGGGLRWFVLRDGRVEPRTPARGGSSRYRFRLWSLCRLATQCGVLSDMPPALLGDDEAKVDETGEAADE